MTEENNPPPREIFIEAVCEYCLDFEKCKGKLIAECAPSIVAVIVLSQYDDNVDLNYIS